MHECAIAQHTIVDCFYFCREVCATILEEESTQIGDKIKVTITKKSKTTLQNNIASNQIQVSLNHSDYY